MTHYMTRITSSGDGALRSPPRTAAGAYWNDYTDTRSAPNNAQRAWYHGTHHIYDTTSAKEKNPSNQGSTLLTTGRLKAPPSPHRSHHTTKREVYEAPPLAVSRYAAAPPPASSTYSSAGVSPIDMYFPPQSQQAQHSSNGRRSPVEDRLEHIESKVDLLLREQQWQHREAHLLRENDSLRQQQQLQLQAQYSEGDVMSSRRRRPVDVVVDPPLVYSFASPLRAAHTFPQSSSVAYNGYHGNEYMSASAAPLAALPMPLAPSSLPPSVMRSNPGAAVTVVGVDPQRVAAALYSMPVSSPHERHVSPPRYASHVAPPIPLPTTVRVPPPPVMPSYFPARDDMDRVEASYAWLALRNLLRDEEDAERRERIRILEEEIISLGTLQEQHKLVRAMLEEERRYERLAALDAEALLRRHLTTVAKGETHRDRVAEDLMQTQYSRELSPDGRRHREMLDEKTNSPVRRRGQQEPVSREAGYDTSRSSAYGSRTSTVKQQRMGPVLDAEGLLRQHYTQAAMGERHREEVEEVVRHFHDGREQSPEGKRARALMELTASKKSSPQRRHEERMAKLAAITTTSSADNRSFNNARQSTMGASSRNAHGGGYPSPVMPMSPAASAVRGPSTLTPVVPSRSSKPQRAVVTFESSTGGDVSRGDAPAEAAAMEYAAARRRYKSALMAEALQ